MLNKTFCLLLLSLIPIFGFSQANSQYPDSGNKIRLGFQTSGDGLIWRDTQPKAGGYQPINNKAAWIILDTINNKFYHYKNSTWTLAGGQDIDTANLIATKYNLGFKLSLADTGNMLTPYWRSGRFSGVLPVANGGTGRITMPAGYILHGDGTSVDTSNQLFWDRSNNRLGIGTNTPAQKLEISTPSFLTRFLITNTENGSAGAGFQFRVLNGGTLVSDATVRVDNDYNINFFIGAEQVMNITKTKRLGLMTSSPTEALHVVGNGLFTGSVTANSLSLTTPLSVANGGTNRTTMPAGYILHGDGTSVDTAIGLFWDRSNKFLGVGTTSPVLDITINSSSTTPGMAFAQNFTNTSAQRGGFYWLNNNNSTVASVIAQAQGDNVGTGLEFSTRPVGGANTLNMVLRENGNVGIGTASPSYKLVSEGSGNAFMYAALSSSIGIIGNWVGYLYGYIGSTYQKGATIFESIDANGRGKFHIALNNVANSSNVSISDAKFTIIPDGNVGIGTTSPSNARLVIRGAGVSSSTAGLEVANLNGNTTFYVQDNGTSRFFGSSLTETMRVNHDGNVGIGTTNTWAKLVVNNGTNLNLAIKLGQSDPTAMMLNAHNDAVNANIPMEFRATKFNFELGNVGIGTTSPGSYSASANKLVVGTTSGNNGITIVGGTTGFSSIYFADGTTGNEAYRGYFEYAHSSDYLSFGTAASEKMRITSGGGLLLGTTTAAMNNLNGVVMFPTSVAVYSNSGNGVLAAGAMRGVVEASIGGQINFQAIYRNSDDDYTNIAYIKGLRENATDNNWASYISFETTNAALTTSERMRISSTGAVTINNLGSGTVTASSGTLTTSSDSTYKIDAGFIDSALDKVMNLKPRYFYWNDKSGLPMDVRQLGFYAQEVNSAIGEEAANTPKENIPWGINDRSLIAFLTKAIQEQQSQIDILKQEIINLKNK